MRLTTACRAKALEAGLWQSADGTMIQVWKMRAPHLINALLKSLASGDPTTITQPLAREVQRRGLEAAAEAEARRRSNDMGSENRTDQPRT